ncbi:MAG: DNA cytosine methyltransferase [Xenococcus sp. (in: cyanobacteria)]
MAKGIQSKYISLDRKSYNAIKQRLYRQLSKCSDRSIGVVCSGGGGVESGAISCRIRPIWGIDTNPINKTKFQLSQMCNDYNELNHGNHVIRSSLQNVDIFSLQKPDIIWASLPCDRASNLSKLYRQGETDLDVLLAERFIAILFRLEPDIVCLENVPAWANFKAFEMILEFLEKHDYKIEYRDYNFAHYGVPQRRTRLIVRACRENIQMLRIPRFVSSGWYDAICDLIPQFEVSEINPKVLNYLINQKVNMSEYILVENVFNLNRSLYSQEGSVCWTIRAGSGIDQNGCSRNKSIALWNPEIKQFQILNSRAIARLAGFPDSYYIPEKSGYAAFMCGLSVPPVFVSKVLNSFVY